MVAAKVEKQEKPSFYITRGDYGVINFLVSLGFERVANVYQGDMVVFPGGADINPFLYGEVRDRTTAVDYAADMADIAALRSTGVYQAKLGICRGAQFLNVMVGNGSLFQHVTDHGVANGHIIKPYNHERILTKVLDANLQTTISVTSTHHQMMIAGDDADILYVANQAMEKHTPGYVRKYEVEKRKETWDDNEVISYPNQMTLCYQPHPEYIGPYNRDNKELFIGLMNKFLVDDKFHENIWNKFYEHNQAATK